MFDNIEFNYWTWWVVALFLIALEIVMPGVFFLWLGVAAALVGFVLLAVDMSWPWQSALFAALAIISTIAGRNIVRRWPTATEDSGLNDRAGQFVGQVFVLIEPMENGHGRVKIGDSAWGVEGPFDAAAGTLVRVTAAHGAVLHVEQAN